MGMGVHHPPVFLPVHFLVSPHKIKQTVDVIDVLGDVAGPGGDGEAVDVPRIPPNEQPQRPDYPDPLVGIATVVGIGKHLIRIGHAVPAK